MELYDYKLDFTSLRFQLWKEQIPDFKLDLFTDYFEIMVPTIETYKMNFIINKLIKNKIHTLIYGSSGTGKTLVLKNFLKNLEKQKY